MVMPMIYDFRVMQHGETGGDTVRRLGMLEIKYGGHQLEADRKEVYLCSYT